MPLKKDPNSIQFRPVNFVFAYPRFVTFSNVHNEIVDLHLSFVYLVTMVTMVAIYV